MTTLFFCLTSIGVKILLEKVVGAVETVDRKLRYFCEDFQEYKLRRAA